jgi:glycosyltransferase involved in cell wall biosynthesis
MKLSQYHESETASANVINFIILQALLPIFGVSRYDHCLHYESHPSLIIRLLRDAGFAYYSWMPNLPSGSVSWTKSQVDIKILTLFDTSIFEKDKNDSIKSLDQIFDVSPEMILGLLGPQLEESIDLVRKWADRGRYQAYQVRNFYLLSRRPLAQSVLIKVQSMMTDDRSWFGEGLLDWFRVGPHVAQNDIKRCNQREKLRNSGFRLAIDGVFFRYQSGLARVWKSLFCEWSINGFAEFIVIIDRDNTAPKFSNIVYVNAPQQNTGDRRKDREILQSICDQLKISLFISTYYSLPINTPAFMLVPDMIPEVLCFDLQQPQWVEKNECIEYVDKYLCISKSTHNDLLRYYPKINPEKVVIAYCGNNFKTQSEELIHEFKQRYKITRPYFMMSTKHKNSELFFKAFSLLGERRADFSIVCTNTVLALEPDLQKYIGGGGFHGLVLNDEELQCAYSGAIALVYPSRYEGFGLPVLEAMACSCPVITCNNSSLPEVGGEAVMYIDPDNVEEMLHALNTIQNSITREGMIAKGLEQSKKFSWREMANTMEDEFSAFKI